MAGRLKGFTRRPAFKALSAHYKQIRETHLRKLFADDPKRGERFTCEAVGIFFDYSKNRISDETLKLLLQLAEENTTKQLEALMKGEKPVDNAHCVLMYFTPKQYKVLEEALVQNGGTRSGRGIVNKEEALLKALKKAKETTNQNA